jgi:hypothetical protein
MPRKNSLSRVAPVRLTHLPWQSLPPGKCDSCERTAPRRRARTNHGLIDLCPRCFTKAETKFWEESSKDIQEPKHRKGGSPFASAGAVNSNRRRH